MFIVQDLSKLLQKIAYGFTVRSCRMITILEDFTIWMVILKVSCKFTSAERCSHWLIQAYNISSYIKSVCDKVAFCRDYFFKKLYFINGFY